MLSRSRRPRISFEPCLTALVLVGFTCHSSWAQREEIETTDSTSYTTINVEVDSSQQKNKKRSLGLALLGSAFLPGAGEIYLREGHSAKSFLVAEIAFWSGVFLAVQSRESYFQSARNQASAWAGASTEGANEEYLNQMVNYRSYSEKEHRQDSYELAQILSGKRDGNYTIPPEKAWDFGSANTPENTQHWKEFQSSMRFYRGAKVALSFATGALILNRLVSVAHTLRVYRRTSGTGLSYRIDPELDVERVGMRLSLAL